MDKGDFEKIVRFWIPTAKISWGPCSDGSEAIRVDMQYFGSISGFGKPTQVDDDKKVEVEALCNTMLDAVLCPSPESYQHALRQIGVVDARRRLKMIRDSLDDYEAYMGLK